MSPYLRDEIKINIGLRYFEKVRFLKNNFSQPFLELLALRLKEVIYPPDDIVLKMNTKSDPKLYIIIKGKAEMYFQLGGKKYDESNLKIVGELDEHMVFGQYEFFSGNLDSKICVRTKGITKMFYLDINDFMNVIQDFPLD